MTTNFDKAIKIVLEREGGYLSADEAAKQGDPGGETKHGISKRAYPEVNIATLTKEQAMDIYLRDYWSPIKGDLLPWPLCLFVFDSAVNQGTHAATRMMQTALGTKDDGVIEPATLELAAKSRPYHASRFMAVRAMRYTTTNNFDKFGNGWMIRLFIVAMAA